MVNGVGRQKQRLAEAGQGMWRRGTGGSEHDNGVREEHGGGREMEDPIPHRGSLQGRTGRPPGQGGGQDGGQGRGG